MNASNPLGTVEEGMSVLDSEGKEIGSVELVKIGDPEATTTEGQHDPAEDGIPGVAGIPMAGPGAVPGAAPGGVAGGIPGNAGMAGPPAGMVPPGGGASEPDLPPSLAERLLRTGYLKIDSKGLFAKDVYVSAEQIREVADGVVHLAVPKNALAKES